MKNTFLKNVKNNRTMLFKGQLNSEANWHAIDSPKKGTDEFVLFAFFTLHGKQIEFVRLFFGRIYGVPNCFSVLSDL